MRLKTGQLLLALSMMTSPMGFSENYTNAGFEAPHFTPGSLENQEGWRVIDLLGGSIDDAVVQGELINEGQHAVLLKNTDQRVLIRKSLHNDTEHWIDIHLLAPSAQAILTNLSIYLRGRDGEGDHGILLSISLNAAGSITEAPSGPDNRYLPEDWNRITIHVKPEDGTSDLYLNDNLIAEYMPLNKETVAYIDTYEVNWTGSSLLPDSNPVVDQFTITSESPFQ